jgi:cytochrome c553
METVRTFEMRLLRLTFALPTIFSLVATAIEATAADAPTKSPNGAKIYEQKCASCHGMAGEGTKEEYPMPLVGDRTERGLAKYIEKEMPKGSPEDCVGEEARQVAEYIHEAFYSRAALIRKEPPRIELSRLTVRQYRHAVADLIGSFRRASDIGTERGLRGEYFGARRFRDRDRALDRVDSTVAFDFGEESPAEKLDPRGFSIRWTGSIAAPETGEYELTVRTEHAARLWVNEMTQPLIDAWVKSGDDTEHRATIYLLGGKVYPVKLEFSKATQGVNNNNNKKKKTPPPVKASVALVWKLPEQAAEVVPQPYLSPKSASEVFVVTTPFPPDDRSIGYERGTAISKAWDQATTDAAIETAAYVAEHLAELSGVRGEGAEREKGLAEFCRKFAERAFRRPISQDEAKSLIGGQFAGDDGGNAGTAGVNPAAQDLDAAVRRVVLLVLKSPRFLYREANAGGGDGFDVAARISFGLVDSIPDESLLKAATSGQLVTREQIVSHVERLWSDRRAQAKLREFLLQWLGVDQPPDLSKDPKRFADFDAELAGDLRMSLDLFLDEVLMSDAADFRQLLLADHVYLNDRLGNFYGVELPPDAPFQKVALDAENRAGVLSHPYLLADLAYTSTSSPIHRGVFIARSVLGRMLRPPPEAVAPLAPDLHASLTTRERVELQTKPAACQRCHSLVNPLGFALERFDAVGRYRKEELGKPIDAKGSYETRDGEVVNFDGVRQLAKFLAESEETQAAFVEQLFHHLVKQPVHAFGPKVLSQLQKSFEKEGFNIRKLVIEIMAVAALPSQAAKQ